MGKSNNGTAPLFAVLLAVALDMVGFGMVVPLLPLYAQRFGVSGTHVAMLFASYSLMQFFFAPLWGQLSDRIGRRPVLLVSMLGNAVCWLLCACAPNFALLLIGRLLAGVCTANIAVAQAYIADVTEPSARAHGMGMIGVAFGIGFVVGPFVGGELAAIDTAAPAFCAAGLSLGNVLLAFFVLRESKDVNAPRAVRGAFAQRLQVLRARRVRLDVLGLIFVEISAFTMMEMAIVLFAKARLGMTAGAAGRLFAYVGIVLVLVQGGALRPLTRRFGEPWLIRSGLSLMSAGLLAVPLVHAPWLLYVAMGLLAAGQALCHPCLGSMLSRHAAADVQGGTLGVGQSASALARTLGPAAGGWVYDAGGVAAPFWAGGAWMTFGLLVALVSLKQATRQPGAS